MSGEVITALLLITLFSVLAYAYHEQTFTDLWDWISLWVFIWAGIK